MKTLDEFRMRQIPSNDPFPLPIRCKGANLKKVTFFAKAEEVGSIAKHSEKDSK
jgi:hypothetical protein